MDGLRPAIWVRCGVPAGPRPVGCGPAALPGGYPDAHRGHESDLRVEEEAQLAGRPAAPGGASERFAERNLEMGGLRPAIWVRCGVPAGPCPVGCGPPALSGGDPDALEAMNLIYEWKTEAEVTTGRERDAEKKERRLYVGGRTDRGHGALCHLPAGAALCHRAPVPPDRRAAGGDHQRRAAEHPLLLHPVRRHHHHLPRLSGPDVPEFCRQPGRGLQVSWPSVWWPCTASTSWPTG